MSGIVPQLSIVIPCRNDAVALRATLDGVSRLQRAQATEVIVAAAGDEARTRDAASGRARLVWPRGSTRAELLNAGAALARAPVLLFLHAESHLPSDAVALIERALRDPAVLSGAFEHSFSERNWRLGASRPSIVFAIARHATTTATRDSSCELWCSAPSAAFRQ